MSFVRLLVIALLFAFGAFFLAMGLEVPIPSIGYHAVPARDLPIGLVLVLAGIAVARFWTAPQDETRLVEDWKRSHKHK